MRGAWGDELIIKTSMRALASIAFMVKCLRGIWGKG